MASLDGAALTLALEASDGNRFVDHSGPRSVGLDSTREAVADAKDQSGSGFAAESITSTSKQLHVGLPAAVKAAGHFALRRLDSSQRPVGARRRAAGCSISPYATPTWSGDR